MSKLALYSASGNSLFAGTAVLLLAIAMRQQPDLSRLRILNRLLLVIGVLGIVLSATPLPLWADAVWAASVAWTWRRPVVRHATAAGPSAADSPIGTALRALPLLVCLGISIGVCLRELWTLSAKPAMHPPVTNLFVIGDSLSAGLPTGETPWPAKLANEHRIQVINLARPGATAATALEQARAVPDDGSPQDVLIAIGGNDLLGGVASTDFAAALRQLLESLQSPHRRVVMLELPLLPGANSYGQVQRDLSREFDARLISKRVLTDVLMRGDATVDGLHLSPQGHTELARRIGHELFGAQH